MNTIWLIANGTFGEAMRRRTLLIFLMVAAVIILAGAANTSLRPQHDTLVIETVGQGVILLTGVLISVILGINLLPLEIERRTVYTILVQARPAVSIFVRQVSRRPDDRADQCRLDVFCVPAAVS